MTKEISLTQGLVAIVDDEDFEYLSQYKWHAITWHRNTPYAVRKTRNTGTYRGTVQMHREILGITDPKVQVDHIDHNGLNNTKSNLRLVSARQNRQNRTKTVANKSGYKGVLKNKTSKSYDSWIARIVINGKQKHIGAYRSPEEAAHAYDEAAKKYFGEYACLNFPEP